MEEKANLRLIGSSNTHPKSSGTDNLQAKLDVDFYRGCRIDEATQQVHQAFPTHPDVYLLALDSH